MEINAWVGFMHITVRSKTRYFSTNTVYPYKIGKVPPVNASCGKMVQNLSTRFNRRDLKPSKFVRWLSFLSMQNISSESLGKWGAIRGWPLIYFLCIDAEATKRCMSKYPMTMLLLHVYMFEVVHICRLTMYFINDHICGCKTSGN